MDFTVDMREKEKKQQKHLVEARAQKEVDWLDMTSCLQEKKEE